MILCAYDTANIGAGMPPLAPEQGSAAGDAATNRNMAELIAACTSSGPTLSTATENQTTKQTDAKSVGAVQQQEAAQ